MKNLVPKIEDTVCISDNVKLAAEISSLKIKSCYYFPVLEGPRMTRPDARNEIIRRNNVLARIQPKKIILTGLGKEAQNELIKRIPKKRLIEITNTTEIDSKLSVLSKRMKKDIYWGPQRLAVGLLKAKRAKCRLRIGLEESPPETFVPGEGIHLVVFEDSDDISAVIAANYAYSIGAALIIIPSVQEEEVEEIIESFYTIYSKKTGESISESEKIKALRSRIRDLSDNLNVKDYKCVTFISQGLPWGFAFPEIPSTHIFSYPDMGVTLANGIRAEQKDSPGIRIAVMIDPDDIKTSEIDVIGEYLKNQGSLVRFLHGREATVCNVSNHIEVFPYDLLVISTHAGEISGQRIEYQFIDSEGIRRELVVDQGVGFGLDPETELVEVREFSKFVSLDGVSWSDPNKKGKLYIGSAIKDYIKLSGDNREELKVISRVDIPRVRGAMALKMFDNNLLPLFHVIAEHNTPIIFNNACNSWKEMSKHFIFSGGRAYIGTMFEVTDIEAKELAINLFTRHGHRPLAFALWRSQNQIYKLTRRPYIMIGPHFTEIRPNSINPINYLINRISKAIRVWKQREESSKEDSIKRQYNEFIKFLESELKILYEEFK